MKKNLFLWIIFLSAYVVSCSQANDNELHTLDLRKCSITIDQPAMVNHIETVEGDLLESQKGLTKLIEIKIDFSVKDSGNFFIHKSIPKLIAKDDHAFTIVNAIAVAIKFTNPESGELIEKYHNEATMLTDVSAGQDIDYYAVFEVPQSAQQYQLLLQTKFMEKVYLKSANNEKY